jgi:hypothetical protein
MTFCNLDGSFDSGIIVLDNDSKMIRILEDSQEVLDVVQSLAGN